MKHKIKKWANIHRDGRIHVYDNAEEAASCSIRNGTGDSDVNPLSEQRIACIPITIEFSEGEGLDDRRSP